MGDHGPGHGVFPLQAANDGQHLSCVSRIAGSYQRGAAMQLASPPQSEALCGTAAAYNESCKNASQRTARAGISTISRGFRHTGPSGGRTWIVRRRPRPAIERGELGGPLAVLAVACAFGTAAVSAAKSGSAWPGAYTVERDNSAGVLRLRPSSTLSNMTWRRVVQSAGSRFTTDGLPTCWSGRLSRGCGTTAAWSSAICGIRGRKSRSPALGQDRP